MKLLYVCIFALGSTTFGSPLNRLEEIQLLLKDEKVVGKIATVTGYTFTIDSITFQNEKYTISMGDCFLEAWPDYLQGDDEVKFLGFHSSAVACK